VDTQHPTFPPVPDDREKRFLHTLLRRETLGGVLALAAALVAVVWANSRWRDSYVELQHLLLGPLDVEHWAADGALALFFFVVGLELKRELVVGSLRRPADAAVPVVAAICGVATPALVYLAVNLLHSNGQPQGWAIPAATDIAFALAVLAVVGSSLPTSLRAFLLTLAVVDDLVVIVIIAVFFTEDLHYAALGVAGLCFAAWAVAQRLRLSTPVIYVPLAVAAWWFTHESGIHATIAGVVLGLLTRVRTDPGEAMSPAEHLEHALEPISSTVAVPFFALMAAGVEIGGGGQLVKDPVIIGVALGLLVGKPLGVFGSSYLVTRFTHAELSEDLTWRDIGGVGVLAGIGFTVSLLVSDLSFDDEAQVVAAKTAVLLASALAATIGGILLHHRDRSRAPIR
jgi:Na+:H+ antiporter, NhaA family